MAETLYKRSGRGKPIMWRGEIVNSSLVLSTGEVNGKIKETIVKTHRVLEEELASRVNKKRKEGYKYIFELHDESIGLDYLEGEGLLNYLNTYLPKFNTTGDNVLLPMLAKTFEFGKAFKNGTYRIAQWKINGLRCLCVPCIERTGFFETKVLKFYSREGKEFKLDILEKYMTWALGDFYDKIFNDNLILDGELYIPGYSINDINHIVKSPKCKEHELIEYWVYDLAIENTPQHKRLSVLKDNLDVYIYRYGVNPRKKTGRNLIVLPNYKVSTDSEIVNKRDEFIELGFEGVILRDPNAEYGFNKRNSTMLKCKAVLDGIFEIVDINPVSIKQSDLPLFKVKNDINDETFDVKIVGSFEDQNYFLRNKNLYIGQSMRVEYRERSGVKQVPFHAVGIEIV